ncbi:MAG: cytochrome C oxidase subunit IV family protein [Bacteroidia bacterium]|nr:cytochrome C oxidase subunit IV family protein [Bacteroidia bacterium]
MSEFHDDFPNYEMMAHHSEEAGVGKRKKLWQVFWIMFGITILELIVGFKAEAWGLLNEQRATTTGLKIFFVFFTIAKAAFIVLSFMHLGDEKKTLKWVILAPYCVFIVYLAVMASVGEGGYSQHHRTDMDHNVVEQAADHKRVGGGGHHDAAEEHHEEGAKEHGGAEGEHK